MVTFPNAKINIGLQIVAKRPDGYHNIVSCFYPVGWSDILEILPAEHLKFTTSGLSIPGDVVTNLCLQAYHLLKTDFDLPPVHIHLHKAVPIGAGLGGGSADGAFTIRTLHELFGLDLSNEQMQKYARLLGSDCAFFIDNQPKYCYEKGDCFKTIDLSSLQGKWIRLVNPQIHISTSEAYIGVKPQIPMFDLQDALRQPIENWRNQVQNDFESNLLIKYPVISTIKETLYAQKALYASMTGSGSTVYGIFDAEPEPSMAFGSCMVWQGQL